MGCTQPKPSASTDSVIPSSNTVFLAVLATDSALSSGEDAASPATARLTQTESSFPSVTATPLKAVLASGSIPEFSTCGTHAAMRTIPVDSMSKMTSQDTSDLTTKEARPTGTKDQIPSVNHLSTGSTRTVGRAECISTPQSGVSTAISSMSATATSAMDPSMFIQQSKCLLTDRYVRERKLGSGAYGEVLLCRDKQSGAERAIKVIKKSSVNPAGPDLLDEVNLLKQLDHPNIMKLYEFFEDQNSYYVVSDVYKGGELFDAIIDRQKFTEANAANTMKQVLSGVCYLHNHKIVHRDLKPENLLLESTAKDALIKIVDFGLSSTFDPTRKLRDRLGTAYYIAPEVLQQQYDEKCDVWSCGVILYILLCGYPPFGGNNDKEILARVAKGKFRFDPPEWDTISPSVKDLISKMLTMDPAKRIFAEQCLQHPWIQTMADQDTTIRAPSLRNALQAMRKFRASQKLAQAALFFMGSKLTTMEETKELTKIFRKLDVNGDGQLDRSELIHGYQLLMNVKGEQQTDYVMTPDQIEHEVDIILDLVDFDKNGTIDYSEFVTVAMDTKTLLSRERLEAAFNLFDIDGSGTIACEELRRILGDVPDEQWIAIIREVDENNDGEVDFNEFVAMMQKVFRAEQK